jgi:hypothetical protein
MKKLYEESELKRLTTSEIDRMKDDTVFIQISETKFERKKDPEYDRYYDAYLCEVMDRDKYERRTKTGQLRKLKKKIHKLKEEKDDLSGRLDAAAEIASAEVRKRQKAEETIEENESRVQGTRTRVRRFTAGDRFVIQNTRSERVKTRTRVSSIYKKEILTVLVMGINKSDTIVFIYKINKYIHGREGGFYEAETKL